MARTTIPVDSATLDRLRTFGLAGQSYDAVLTQLMDLAARHEFVQEVRRIARETPREAWVDLADVELDPVPK